MKDLKTFITESQKINFKDLLNEFSDYLSESDIAIVKPEDLKNNVDEVNHFITYDNVKYFWIPNGEEDEDRFETKMLAEEMITNIAEANGIDDFNFNTADDYSYGYKKISKNAEDNAGMKLWSTVYSECENGTCFSFIEYEKNMDKFIEEINNNYSSLYK